MIVSRAVIAAFRLYSSSRSSALWAFQEGGVVMPASVCEGGSFGEYGVDSSIHKASHRETIDKGRDYESISEYWKQVVSGEVTPPEWIHDGVHAVGSTPEEACMLQCNEEDPREMRNTWFVTLAYHGPAYRGWQFLKGERTVAGDLSAVLHEATSEETRVHPMLSCAGRTDAGVSGYGQVASFYTWEAWTKDFIKEIIESTATNKELRVLHVQQVPRSLHSTFSAKWRRYVYLLPLNEGPFGGFDLSISRADAMLKQISGEPLLFAALMHGRVKANVLKDECTLYEASAQLQTVTLRCGKTIPVMAVMLTGDRFLRRMVRIMVSTLARESMLVGQQNEYFVHGSPEALRQIMRLGRTWACTPAPAEGLCMMGAGFSEWNVRYSKKEPDDEG